MKPAHTAMSARSEELLMKRALSGLTEDEAAELRESTDESDESFDLAVAALDLATLPVLDEPLPAAVAAKILATAQQRLPASRATRQPTRRWRAQASWGWLAAAALLIVVLGMWWSTRRPPPTQIVYVPVAASPSPPPSPPPSLFDERAKFIADQRDVVTIKWTPTADVTASGVSGEVVWSPAAQRGYMRFVGIAPNDRKKFQYQLWIFDKERDARYPVDGGVFDVSAAGELIVPIRARLPIGKLTLFAVTVERPGGVVVSDRKRIVVTASAT